MKNSDIEGSVSRINEHLNWNGEGYPAVEMICEYQVFESEIWRQCEVVARRKGGWVVLDDECETAFVTLPDIRPIRTPDQIAAEERKHDIENALSDIRAGFLSFPNDLVRGNIARSVVEAMLDAGYRKQVKP